MENNFVQIIDKKSKNLSLTTEEINYFVNGIVSGEVPDYQSSALLMAIKINGLNDQEFTDYAKALIETGETFPLNEELVDKHSTGGVGDKTSIALLPILGAMGVKIFKMSGRGLGFTGGTIDKLESVDGFNPELSIDELKEMVDEIGISISSQTPNLTPADGILYKLRDVTATVDSIPLIAASIISKKIASGAKHILIDLKIGTGAFISNMDEAKELARLMKLIANEYDRNLFILFSSMNQPLGFMSGNKIEIVEALDLLRNEPTSHDFQRLVRKIAFELYSKVKNTTVTEGAEKYDEVINDGSALALAKKWFSKHGVEKFHGATKFKPRYHVDVVSPESGHVSFKNVKEIGNILTDLKAGRKSLGDELDYSAGIIFKVKGGEMVWQNDPLFTITSTQKIPQEIIDRLLDLYIFTEKKYEHNVLLGEVRW